MSELKYERLGDAFNDYPDSTLVIRKQFVDAAIAELKDENRRLKRALWLARAERANDKAMIFYYAMTERFNLNINGYSQKEKGHTRMRPAQMWRLTWLKVESKCRAKAEKYK